MKEILFKKGFKRRLLSVTLALTMVFSMMPGMTVRAAAHTTHTAESCYNVAIDIGSDRWYAYCDSSGRVSVGDILGSGMNVFVQDESTDFIYINGVKVVIDPMVRTGTTLTEDMIIEKFEGRSIYLKSMPSSHSHDSIDFDNQITSAGGTLTTGNYYLDDDVTLTTNLTINGDVNLCLNGHVLKGNGGESVIKVNTGATLNLYDCDSTTVHYFNKTSVSGVWNVPNLWQLTDSTTAYSVIGGVITGGDITAKNGAGVYVEGTFTMHAGNIVGNITRGTGSTNVYGAAVYTALSGSTFTMNGGSIVGNLTNGKNSNGAGVYLGAGTFNLNGGRIADNYSGYGAAFGTRNSTTAVTVNMTGGLVENNHVLYGGGAAFLDGNKAKAVLNMSGGKIINNSAELYNSSRALGGGLFIASNTTVNMSGNAEISGNSAVNGGGGVIFENASPTFNMSENAKVCNNTSNSYGGGVYIQYGGNLTMSGNAEISGNSSAGYGGGVCAQSYNSTTASNLTIQGNAKIINNTATTNGGGVYVDNNSKITVGETAQITGNKKGSDANNVFLTVNRTIAISTTNPASTGMSVGVTTATAPTAGNPVKIVGANGDSTNYKYFTSDTANRFAVLCDGSKDLSTTEAEIAGCHSPHAAGTIWLAVHAHDWKYTVGSGDNANKITAKCEGYDDCTVTDGKTTGTTLTISASSTNYSGSAIPVTVTAQTGFPVTKTESDVVYYESDGTTLVPTTNSGAAATGKAPKLVGTYVAKLTVADVTASITYTISEAEITSVTFTEPTAPVATATPEATVTGLGSNYTGTIAWTPAATTFDYSTVYTATINLTAADNYKFKSDVTIPANWTKSDTSTDTTLVITRTYAATVEYHDCGSGIKQDGQSATCTVDGWKDYYKCSICDKLYEEAACTTEISNLASWKTTEGQGKIAAVGHDYTGAEWSKDSTNHWHECIKGDCSDKDGSKKDVAAHSYDGSTYLCVCGMTPPPHEHNSDAYGSNATTHWTKCLYDEDNNGTPADHVWLDGTCSVCSYTCTHGGATHGICSTCGKDLGEAPPTPKPSKPAPDMTTTNIGGLSYNTWEDIIANTPELTVEKLHEVNFNNEDLLHVNIYGKVDKLIPAEAIEALDKSSIRGLHVFVGDSDAITFLNDLDYSKYTSMSFKHEDVIEDNRRVIDFTSKGKINATVMFHTLIAPDVKAKVYKVIGGKEVEIATISSNEDGGLCFLIDELATYVIKY